MTSHDLLAQIFAIGPISPSILELDISQEVRLPEDYDDGPFAVPDLRGDNGLAEDEQELM